MKNVSALLKRIVLIPLLAASAVACDEDFGPTFWDATPDTVFIYSASRPQLLGLPSAYDFVNLARINIESASATGAWDVVLAEQNGQFVLVPASAFPGIVSRAGIARVTGTDLAAILEAPRDTADFDATPVTIDEGAIYVVRTRRAFCNEFGTDGVRYAKIQAVDVDATAGTFRFVVVRNPFCNDRALIPPD
jgi:hypothetical protein